MKVPRLKILLLSAGLLLLHSCVQRDPGKRSFLEGEGIGTSFQQVFEENELMGMSLLLMSKGQTVWEGYYGLADHSRQIPVSPRTMYRVASISKMVTATAVLQLWEAGRVELDRDVSRYLGWELRHPGYKNHPITLRQLMSHQSGIRDCPSYYDFAGNMISEKLDIRDLFMPDGKYFSDELFADHPPGATALRRSHALDGAALGR